MAAPTTMRTIFTLLLTLMLASAPFALADDADGKDEEPAEHEAELEQERAEAEKERAKEREEEREDDDRVEGVRRKTSLDVSDDTAQIKLSREVNGTEDAVKIKYEASEGTMKVAYETENATHETETELKVKFREAVEFRDADADGAYDPGEEIVAEHNVEDLDWRIVGPEPVTSASGTPGQRLTGIGDFDEGGALVFVLYVYGDFADVNGTTLRPSEVKIDIILDHFPFQANDTLAALIVKSEQESKLEVEGEEDGMSATANGITAYFSWADNATVDGVVTPVHTTVLESESKEGESEQKFALAYARGAFVNHDPVLGVMSASETEPVSAVPGAGVLALVGVVGLAALALRRRT